MTSTFRKFFKMTSIKTYLILDLETTGIPGREYSPTKITELSFAAVMKSHFDDPFSSIKCPRVQNKLTLCFHPQKHIMPEASKITGLTNEMLEEQTTFNESSFQLIELFLSRLPSPICMIAHNGNRFDFPLILSHVKAIGKKLPDDLLCADSLLAFRDLKLLEMNFSNRWLPNRWRNTGDILEGVAPLPGWEENDENQRPPQDAVENEESNSSQVSVVEILESVENAYCELTPKSSQENGCKSSESSHPRKQAFPQKVASDLDVDKVFEEDAWDSEILQTVDRLEALYGSTPKQKKPVGNALAIRKVKPTTKTETTPTTPPGRPNRRGANLEHVRKQLFPQKKLSYKLGSVYEHITGSPMTLAHSSEGDASALLECIAAIGEPFHEWVLKNCKRLNTIYKK